MPSYQDQTWIRLWKENAPELRSRVIGWRKQNAITRIDKPSRLDRARRLGYKAKQGIVVVRMRVGTGGMRKQRPTGGRRPKHLGVTRIKADDNMKTVAERRVLERYPNMKLLGSYYIYKDGKHYWFEIILADPSHPRIAQDKELNQTSTSICIRLKSIVVFLVILFFVIPPTHGQLLSDATGLINRMNIQTSGYDFEVVLTANFDLLNYSFDKNEKQLTLYVDNGLENNIGEIIIPTTLLSGEFRFYLNDQEFFPKVQSDERINFITMNFIGLGNNVIKISGTEYLSGLDDVIPIENNQSDSLDNDFLPPNTQSSDTFFGDYLIWLIVGGIVIVIAVFVVIKFLKNKN